MMVILKERRRHSHIFWRLGALTLKELFGTGRMMFSWEKRYGEKR